MNIIPSFVRARYGHSPILGKIANNIGWLFFDKLLRIGLGFVLGVWIARYLGPTEFGEFSFATAFTGLFAAMAGLGLQGIVVRDMVRSPTCKEETIGTAALLQLAGGVITYAIILLSISLLRSEDSVVRSLVAILGSTVIFKATDVGAYWFESQVSSKFTVWVQNSSFLFFGLTKVGFILSGASLFAFAWATLAETALAGFLILFMLDKHGPKLNTLKASVVRAKSLLKDSWPLLLSGIAIAVNMKIDQIMLGQMLDSKSVGIYSAGVRISELWYLGINIVLVSVFPSMAKLHNQNDDEINRHWTVAYGIMFWVAVAAAVLLTISSEIIVNLMFGASYSDAANVVAIYAWAGINVAMGSVWSTWILLENKLRIGLYAQLTAALLNVLLNYLLIPKFGIDGAAVASLMAYTLSAILSYCLYKPFETFKFIVNGIAFRKVLG